MKSVIHIVDDGGLGGVNRLLNSLIGSMSDDYDHRKVVTPTKFRFPRHLKADVIIIHFTASWSNIPFIAALRACCAGARIILVEHTYTAGYEERCVRNRVRFRAMLRMAYCCVDQVISVSYSQAHWITDSRLTNRQKVTVVPCVLDLMPFEQLALPTARCPMVLGAFGRFHRQKGFDTLIEAMHQVDPLRARLILAGYGPDETALRTTAAGLSNVEVRGPVDPVAFLAEVDAVVMPSRWEAGAVTCWEARAAGRPMIVSSVDGLPEQMPRSMGLVVPPEDPDALATAIALLAAGDRTEMSQRARQSTIGAYAETFKGWKASLEGFEATPERGKFSTLSSSHRVEASRDFGPDRRVATSITQFLQKRT